MAGRTLYDKIWESHTVCILPTGQTQLFIGLHLIHEITTAPAFDMLREKGMDIAVAERTFATVDHIVPTDVRTRPFLDGEAEELTQALEKNVKQFGVEFFGLESANQGIVHVIGPQLGLTQPGMTLACGDSHTSTHGALVHLPEGARVMAPCLTASTRSAWRRLASRGWIGALGSLGAQLPLLRVGLHPADARDPRTMATWERVLAQLLAARAPLTKSEAVRRYACARPAEYSSSSA